jgi:hypothetical protein
LIVPDYVFTEDSIKKAILTIMKYVQDATGTEATQEEIAEALKSYFILNEVGNQIKYQIKKRPEKEAKHDEIKKPGWTLNLMTGPGQNTLAKAGFFHKSILAAIQATREYMIKTTGAEPSNDIIARSLKSSFILSEIKNQIEWQRKNSKMTEDSGKGS